MGMAAKDEGTRNVVLQKPREEHDWRRTEWSAHSGKNSCLKAHMGKHRATGKGDHRMTFLETRKQMDEM